MNTTEYNIRLEAVRCMQQLFPCAHRSPRRKSISFSSAISAGLTRWPIDWQIDRPC